MVPSSPTPLPSFTDVDDDPRQVEYLEIRVKSALHIVRRPYMSNPFTYTLNLYRGCRHGCPYCFARYTHWFLGFQNSFDFQRKIQVKVNVLERLREELEGGKFAKQWVSLGAATDPYQPAEKKYRLARGAFAALARHAWPAAFSTKSDLVLRDLDVLKDLALSANAGVAMTLTTLDKDLKAWLEPHAVSIESRLRALEVLKANRIPCGIHLMPVIPFLTDGDEALESMVRKASELGVDYFYFNVLRLRGQVVRGYFFERLKVQFPKIYWKLRNLYGRNAEAPKPYRENLSVKMKALREKWSVKNRKDWGFPGDQLDFFGG